MEAKYVSPLGYVLGYVAYHNNFMIEEDDSSSARNKKTKKLDQDIFSELERINDVTGGIGNYGVFPPDVIRYMRFWGRIRG